MYLKMIVLGLYIWFSENRCHLIELNIINENSLKISYKGLQGHLSAIERFSSGVQIVCTIIIARFFPTDFVILVYY